jgi:hypothetical protein
LHGVAVNSALGNGSRRRHHGLGDSWEACCRSCSSVLTVEVQQGITWREGNDSLLVKSKRTAGRALPLVSRNEKYIAPQVYHLKREKIDVHFSHIFLTIFLIFSPNPFTQCFLFPL